MFNMISRRLTYANITATLALLFAMSGGAYAASKFLITSTKQISPKVQAALKGKAGPAGKVGATGPAGPGGPAGPAGPAGAPGVGKEGPAGQGVEGKEGKEGKEGSPWTAGGTLPSGKSETGTWGYTGAANENEKKYVSISFPIPLKTAPAVGSEPVSLLSKATWHQNYIGLEGGEGEAKEANPFPSGCKGTAAKPATARNPVAQPGNLCVYASGESSMAPESFFNAPEGPPKGLTEPEGLGKAGVAGTLLQLNATETVSGAQAYGVWVVTAK